MSESEDLPEPWTHEPHDFLVYRDGNKVADIDTSATPGFKGKKADAAKVQPERNARFAELQEMLYANSKGAGDNRSLLLVLQGMDTAGKGGIVKHVVGAANPQGIRYHAFGVPTEEERKHNYLWRIRRALPTAGNIGVFDRSHYEDVLVVRVHDLVPPDVWGKRYDEINRFEKQARRQRHDDHQGGDVRLAGRAEEAVAEAAATARTSTGSTTRKTSTSGCCGRSTRRRTRRCWRRRPPITRRGT